jgi:hypothetical protein
MWACGSNHSKNPGDPPAGPADSGWITPIEFGTPGPWSAEEVSLFGAAQGLDEAVVDASTDEAEYLWVVSRGALYLMRPGETSFQKFTGADGLFIANAMPPGITAVCGGAPGEVFVGYRGADIDDVQTNPERFKGKLDRALLHADGSLQVTHYDIHNNDAVGFDSEGNVIRLPNGKVDPQYTDWSFHEDRTVERFLYDHLDHRGTLYIGYNHGVGRIDAGKVDPITGFDYADHVHPMVINSQGTQRMGAWRALALDPMIRKDRKGRDASSILWMGGRWTAGAATWTPSLYDWTSNPRNPLWVGFSSPPVFPVAEGDDVYILGIAPLSDGTVLFASGPGDWGFTPLGIARMRGGEATVYLSPESDLGLPSRDIVDMQRLPDDTVLIALRSDGLWRWNPNPAPKGQAPARIAGLPSQQILRVYVDRMVNPTAVWVSTGNGLALLRLP